MSDFSTQNFDDPALKEALRQNFSGVKTPEGMRARIAARIASEAGGSKSGNGTTSHSMRITAPVDHTITMGFSAQIPGFAIAACMLIAVGLAGIFMSQSPQKLNATFANGAIARHDECCGAPDHHNPAVPHSSLAIVGKYLVQELKHPVMVPDLDKDGYKFAGASICPINGVPTAHLLYRSTKNTNTLSMFSLPTNALNEPGTNHRFESSTTDGHSVIVRQSQGALYCMVSNCPKQNANLPDMAELYDQHQKEVVMSIDPTAPRIVLVDVHYEK